MSKYIYDIHNIKKKWTSKSYYESLYIVYHKTKINFKFMKSLCIICTIVFNCKLFMSDQILILKYMEGEIHTIRPYYCVGSTIKIKSNHNSKVPNVWRCLKVSSYFYVPSRAWFQWASTSLVAWHGCVGGARMILRLRNMSCLIVCG